MSFPIHQFSVVAGRSETLRSLKFKPCLAAVCLGLGARRSGCVYGSASDFRGLMRGFYAIEEGFWFSV